MSTVAKSSVYSRLHGVFAKKVAALAVTPTSSTAATPAVTPTSSTAATPAVDKSVSVKDLYKARSLERLVAMFKESSKQRRFRARWGIYEETVRRLVRSNRRHWVEEILEEQKKYPDIKKEGFNVRLMRLYGDASMFEHARKVFDEMPQRCERTVLSFNALLAAAVHSRKYDVANELFKELPEELGLRPDVFSYNTVIKGLCEKGELNSAALLIDQMKENHGCEPNVVTFNTLLNGFYSKGKFEEGDAIWDRLMVQTSISPDAKSYSAKLMGLAMQKRSKEAVELLAEMEEKEIQPDAICRHYVILGFVKEGNMEKAKHWYLEMKMRECKPHRMTFSALIPFACENGDAGFGLELAKDIFSMKHLVDVGLLQKVVDALVKEERMDEAEVVRSLGMNNGYHQYKLSLPSL
ncbi:Pentatricopeptide repeat-containing protein At3g13160, mitochondrial [Linum perenne]